MKPTSKVLLSIAVLALALTACSASAPRLIASHPASDVPPPGEMTVVSETYIELEVTNPAAAAERATQAAYDLGGYLNSSQSWRDGNREFISLTLAVPTIHYEDLRRAVLKLGHALDERLTNRLVEAGPGDYWVAYAYLTLQLRSKNFNLPEWPAAGWHPERTLASAWNVFITIFGFIADVLIWLVVVIGPFALLGLVGWALFKRLRRQHNQP